MLTRVRSIIKIKALCRPLRTSAIALQNEEGQSKDMSGSVGTKFQVFRNETGIVFDIEEERRQGSVKVEDTEAFAYSDFNLERGVNGVFEIKDLMEVLEREKAKNLCVIKLPKNLKYVDYLCLADGKSYRHMLGMAYFVRKMYKLKRHTGDIIPKIEGEKCRDWIAMDMGNIALHIFSKSAREHYDLESLWCLGEEYEKRIRNKDLKEEMYQEYLKAAAAQSPFEIVPKAES